MKAKLPLLLIVAVLITKTPMAQFRLGVKAGVNIQRSTKDCAINGACFLSTTDHRFTLPIPNAEISANPAISGQQNTGY